MLFIIWSLRECESAVTPPVDVIEIVQDSSENLSSMSLNVSRGRFFITFRFVDWESGGDARAVAFVLYTSERKLDP